MQELNKDADIVNVRFTKSVIASKAAFTYEEAQIRKDDPCVSAWLCLTIISLRIDLRFFQPYAGRPYRQHPPPQRHGYQAQGQAHGRWRAQPRIPGSQDPHGQYRVERSCRRGAERTARDQQPCRGVHVARKHQRGGQDSGDVPTDCGPEASLNASHERERTDSDMKTTHAAAEDKLREVAGGAHEAARDDTRRVEFRRTRRISRPVP